MENAIETVKLTKRFKEVLAVDAVSFSVRKGEIFGFLGPNGAGKTTTIRMLCTLTRPTEGSATVAGHDIVKSPNKVRNSIGLVSEKMIMYDRLTAYENLKLFAKLYNLSRDEMTRKIDELLELVHMQKWRDSQIGTFSTGMKQRINVIRALLNEPGILFLDEPTLGLDPQSTAEIREFIQRINKEQGSTIILTTHMMVEAEMLCDRVGIIDKGKIVALDTPDNLKKMVSQGTDSLIEMEISNLTSEMIGGLKGLECVTNLDVFENTKMTIQARGDHPFDAIIDAVRSKGGIVTSVKTKEPTLEDVFLHLTGRTVREETKKAKNASGRGPHSRGSAGRRVR